MLENVNLWKNITIGIGVYLVLLVVFLFFFSIAVSKHKISEGFFDDK
jgi:hypothetical protein